MDEYDSGDDLFDDVEEEELCRSNGYSSSSGPVHGQKRKCDESDGALYTYDAEDTSRDAAKRYKSSNLLSQTAECEHEPAENTSHLDLARRLLSDKFGYKSFRYEQEAAIQRVLAGENTLVVFPTGAGKSLCYQIPAIAFPELDAADGQREDGSAGVTIVVSPLLALMKDQVDALKRRGIAADCMDSLKSWNEMQQIHLALRKGELRLLYCAPERLNNEGFITTIMNVPGGIRLVAIDEAHCISEWGHAFRPDYLKIARFVEEINARSVICLTATATPKVAQDVCNAFKIKQSCAFRTSPYRPNLQLLAQAVHSKDENTKWEELFCFLRAHPGSTLIYVALQEQAETHAKVLRQQGFKAQAFHAGMKAEDKIRIQNDFMASRIPIICATIAFGMGIDKADIRNVVHWDLSSTIEEYSQQIGRAGRDGQISHCMYYLSHNSFYMREVFARGDLPSFNSLKLLLKDIFNSDTTLGVGDVLKINHLEQSKTFDIRASPLNIIYAMLELHHGLFRAITPEYSKYAFEPRPSYYAMLKSDHSAEAKAIVSNSVKAAKWHHIDVSSVAGSQGLKRGDIVNKLNYLDRQGHIQLKGSGVVHRYRILKALPRSGPYLDKLVAQLYTELESREKDGLRRAREIMSLITGSKCFALALAEHFGMSLPDGKTCCGHCTYCMTKEPVVAPSISKLRTTAQSIKPVLDAIEMRDDPRFLARVGFGIKSPRVTQSKLDRLDIFRSLALHDFDALVAEFTKACDAANRQAGEY